MRLPRRQAVEPPEGLPDVVQHGDVHGTVLVVPIQVNFKVALSLATGQNCVVLLKYRHEVFNMFLFYEPIRDYVTSHIKSEV